MTTTERTALRIPAAPAHEDGVRDVLLVALTVSAGAVDAIAWLGLGKVFSAFMTGNLVFVGLLIGGADGPSAWRVLASIAAFAVGALLAAAVVKRARDDGKAWSRQATVALAGALAVQAAFLVVWALVDGRPSSRAGDVLIALSAVAMGMQTTAIFSLGVRAAFTTATTATLAVLAGDLTGWGQSRGERRRLTAMLAGLLAGAAVGGFLIDHALRWAPVFPLAVSAVVVAAAVLVFLRPRP